MNKELLLEARKLIAGFLKERREELGISVQDLAEKCNVQRSTIWRFEENKFPPNMELVLKICYHLGCRIVIH